VGEITLGLTLVAVGVLVLLSNAGQVSLTRAFEFFWPAILVLLGLEVLVYTAVRPGEGLRFHGGAIALLIISVLVSGALAAGANVILPSINVRGDAMMLPVSGDMAIDSSVRRVVVEIQNAELHTTGVAGDTLRYEGKLRVNAGSQAEAEKLWKVETVGDTVYLRQERQSAISFGLSSLGHAYLNVDVPADVAVQVSTTNGQLEVKDFNVDVIAKTTNGKLRVSNVKANVDVSTTNGVLEAENILGNATLATTNGALAASELGGSLDAVTTNASVSISSHTLAGNWDIMTTNAATTVSVPREASVALQARTSNGTVRSDDFTLEYSGDKRTDAHADLNGGAFRVDITTTNSSVNVNYAD
jgi:hypothetical protein